ncbi:gluconate 5-dehydrogenase [Yersinia wautersii]|uniref:gluconate 5-dehydrogenase n=1 Tax=Yersinia pseudotuberculosis TaxID=633 RepID=UPI0035901F6D
MDVFTASLRSACSLRRGHFVNNLTHINNACSLFILAKYTVVDIQVTSKCR